MAPKIYGNVRPEDDYTHPLGPEQNFNESVYFNFFDRAQQVIAAIKARLHVIERSRPFSTLVRICF